MSFELLKKRALSFFRDAQSDYEHGEYHLVLFHVEQSIQLYSKYLLYRRIGDYPKTHSIIKLLKDLVKVYAYEELNRFMNNNLEALYLLEEAYYIVTVLTKGIRSGHSSENTETWREYPWGV
ncbi:MAG: HEPN domain-containing protein [Candidatus Bathyarchaeia archaeon]